jgi:hypothetical protein
MNKKRLLRSQAKPEWEIHLVTLEEKGYQNTKCNIRLLHKMNGNINAVIDRLNDLKSRKLSRQAAAASGGASKGDKDEEPSNTIDGSTNEGDGDNNSNNNNGKDNKLIERRARRAIREASRLKRQAERTQRSAQRLARRGRQGHNGEHASTEASNVSPSPTIAAAPSVVPSAPIVSSIIATPTPTPTPVTTSAPLVSSSSPSLVVSMVPTSSTEVPSKKEKKSGKSGKNSKVIEVPIELVKGNERLIKEGYTKVSKNIRFLQRFNGNVEHVLAKYSKMKKNNMIDNGNKDDKDNNANESSSSSTSSTSSSNSSGSSDEDKKANTTSNKKDRSQRKRKCSNKLSSKGNDNIAVVAVATDIDTSIDGMEKHKKEKSSSSKKGGRRSRDGNGNKKSSSSGDDNNNGADDEKKVTKVSGFEGMEFNGYGRSYWPLSIKHLYLDGNNMLYVTNSIRKLALKRSSLHLAEDALAHLANSFTIVSSTCLLLLLFIHCHVMSHLSYE